MLLIVNKIMLLCLDTHLLYGKQLVDGYLNLRKLIRIVTGKLQIAQGVICLEYGYYKINANIL